jgi:polyvinyl alcohol dehydrogenase (cytochrome)
MTALCQVSSGRSPHLPKCAALHPIKLFAATNARTAPGSRGEEAGMAFQDRFSGRWLVFAAVLPFAFPVSAAAANPASLGGDALYRQRCAACHDNPGLSSRTPAKARLAALSPNDIFDILSTGGMAPMAAGLGTADLDAITLHLTGKAPVHVATRADDPDIATACKTVTPPAATGPRWNGWSPTLDNARFQAETALKARDVPKLKVKWAFAFAGGVGGQPAVVGGRVYFGTGAGRVYALDAGTGCLRWRAEIKGGVRAAVTVDNLAGPSGKSRRLAVFVGDRAAGVHALDAATGKEIWSTKVETHPLAMITGSPVLYRGRLYVPVSSTESASTFAKDYRCCAFRGSIGALDAANGKLLWQSFTIAEAPKPYRIAPDGRQLWGPAGAAIWSAPTIDARRGVLYAGSGNAYSDAPNTGSDAVTAMDLITGKVRWSRQLTANDNFMSGCTGLEGQAPACPRTVGPDHDVGNSPILRVLPNGRTVLLTAQKSGEVTALDPDRAGAVLWKTRLSLGSALGGVEWGMAADRSLLFVPIADPYTPRSENKGGMYALRLGDGSIAWSQRAPDPNCAIAPRGSLIELCTSGLSSAPTAIEGLVIEGSLDGILRAYDVKDGSIVWSFDVGQTRFQPLNAPALIKGDTMNGAGATVAGDTLFQISGYHPINPKAMSLLLAFTLDGK